MKNIKRLVAVLRTLGVVVLILALTATIYIYASSGSLWGDMKDRLTDAGASAGMFTRLRFNADVYGALSEAAGNADEANSARVKAIAPYFESYNEAGTAAEAEKAKANVQATYDYFANEFDSAAFMESYEKREHSEDDQALKAEYEVIDNLLRPASKSGKKLPAVSGASSSEVLEEYYAGFAEEHGDEAGSLLDFVSTVSLMLQKEIDAGNSYTAVGDYLDGAFTYEEYAATLPEVQTSESADNSASFLDEFAAVAAQQLTGEKVDYQAFFEGAYADLQARYPNETLPAYELYVPCVRALIDSGVAFDGAYSTVYGKLQEAERNANTSGFAAFIATFCDSVIKNADESSNIGGVGTFWRIISLYWLMWLGGVALLIIAKITDYLLSNALINKQERTHVQEDPDVLLRVNHLKQYFRSGDFVNKAVDDVSFYVKKGEVFGLVGESGCGKTTTGRTIINLYDPTDGDVYFQGLRISSNQNGLPVLIRQLRKDHADRVKALEKEYANGSKAELAAKKKELRKELSDSIEQAQIRALESSVEKKRSIQMYRELRRQQLTDEYEKEIKTLSGEAAEERTKRFKQDLKIASKDNIMTKMQMIFQDPIASINPRMTVREIIAEGLIIRGVKDKKYIDERVNEMLELVGLVREHADRYPHEFSGGQRQRIGIARAIVLEPDLIIADEPISALDVSIQAQVINLLNELRNKMGLTIMFIAHNLSVVKYFSDRIAVMYFGRIVEMTTSDELFAHPLHPYTKSLLSAIPYPDPHYEKQRKRIEYNPTLSHDYTVDKPSMREITPGHFIYCNDAEEAKYKKELGI